MSAALALTESVTNIARLLHERPPQHWLLNRAASEIDNLGRRLSRLAPPENSEIAGCLEAAMRELTAAHLLPEEQRPGATGRAIEHLHAAVACLAPLAVVSGGEHRPDATLNPELHEARPAAGTPPPPSRPSPVPARRQPMPDRDSLLRILIVERDQTVRSLQRLFLERAGLCVEFADDGEEAFSRVLQDPPAVVVTEILVPKLDGLALCRRLREDPQTRAIPVIVFSILAAGQRAGEAGANAFLRKPLVDSTFVAAVQDLIAAHPNSDLEHQWAST